MLEGGGGGDFFITTEADDCVGINYELIYADIRHTENDRFNNGNQRH